MADQDDLIISISTDLTSVKRQLSKLVGDVDSATSQISRKWDTAGKSIDKSMTTALQARIDAMVGIGTKATNEWNGALADQGKQLEALRAKYSPLFATITQYKTNLADLKRAYSVGAISSAEFTAAQSRERQATLANIAAIKGRNAALDSGAKHYQTANLAFQGQDILTSAIGGASATTIGFQQGPQIASVIQELGSGKNIISGLGAALTSLVSPISIASIGLTIAAAAAIQFGEKLFNSASKAEEVLKKHEDSLKSIKKLFDDAAASSEQYGQTVQGSIQFSARQDQTQLQDQLATQLKSLGNNLNVTGSRSAQNDAMAKYGALFDAVRKFSTEAASGKGDVAAFNAEIERIANADPANTQLQKTANRLRDVTKDATDTAQAIKDLNDEVAKTTLIMSRTDEAIARQKYNNSNADSLFDLQRRQKAALGAIGAKSPAAIAAAARANVAAEPINPSESPDNRQYRIDSAGALAQAQAENSLKEAQKDRAASLQKLLADQQNEISLVGKVGGAEAALREEYQLTSQLRLDAAKNGIDADQKEIDLIKQKSAEYGKLVDTLAKVKLSQDLSDKARMRTLSPGEQQVATTLRQYGLPDDLNSPQAAQIRKSLQIDSADDAVKGFLTSFRDGVVNNGGNVGKAFADAVKESFLNALTKASDAAIQRLTNSLVDALFGGSGSAGAGSAGAIGGIASKIVSGAAPVIRVTRAPLGDLNSYAGAIKSIESGGNYSAVGPMTASGDRAYGAYQVMGANIPSWTKAATGTSLSTDQFLSSQEAQDAVFNKYFGASVSKFGNPQDAASVWFSGRPLAKAGLASDGFNTTPEYVTKFNNALGDASKSVGTFGNGLGQLSSSFFPSAPSAPSGGGGLGWLSSLFGGAFKPIGAQASLAASGSIVGLFADGGHVAGAGSATSDSIPAWLSNGEFVVNAAATKKNRKLLEAINTGKAARFATGGLVSSRLVQAPTGPSLETPSTRGSNGGQPGVLQVHINGANGDDHVRQLVKQGVSEGLSSYNDNQVRGGFGSNQNRWQARKS